MFNIQSYLQKFVTLGMKNEETKKSLQATLTSALGKEIAMSNISFRKGIVEVKESSAYKNLIFMKKSSLLESFKTSGIAVFDIR